MHKNYVIFFLFFLLLFSCKNNPKVILVATKDAYLSSLYPTTNFDGKREAFVNFGYGTKKNIDEEIFITYPALYLTNSQEDKSAFIIGGFDFSKLKKKVNSAYLRFFINYSLENRKRIPLIIRPVIREWKEDVINFNSIYLVDSLGYLTYSSIVETDLNKCKIIYFNIMKTDVYKDVIPFKKPAMQISVDITNMINEIIEKNKKIYGFLIEAMDMENPNYFCTNLSNVLVDIGVLEILSSEIFYWDGKVPSNFTISNGKWAKVKNKAKGKIKYIPRIEVY